MKNNLKKLAVNVTGGDINNVVEKIMNALIELSEEHDYTEDEITAMTIYVIGSLSAKAGIVVDKNKSIGECLPAFMDGYNFVKQADAH